MGSWLWPGSQSTNCVVAGVYCSLVRACCYVPTKPNHGVKKVPLGPSPPETPSCRYPSFQRRRPSQLRPHHCKAVGHAATHPQPGGTGAGDTGPTGGKTWMSLWDWVRFKLPVQGFAPLPARPHCSPGCCVSGALLRLPDSRGNLLNHQTNAACCTARDLRSPWQAGHPCPWSLGEMLTQTSCPSLLQG